MHSPLACAREYQVNTQADFSELNNIDFEPGDVILLKAGETFNGNLLLEAEDSGTNKDGHLIQPIVITSSGMQKATINAGDGFGIYGINNGGFTISGIRVVGSGVTREGQTTNTESGIFFFTDSDSNIKYEHVHIDRVEVSGFGDRGIKIGGFNGTSGYTNVRITNAIAHSNLNSGIETFGYTDITSALTNVVVSDSIAYNNFGDPAKQGNTGNGIVLGSVDGGTIQRSIAYNNGQNNKAPTEGPVGIWAYNANNITIQFNESYRNRTQTRDGGGFDLDQNVTNSVLQYNYSHDNEGAGYLIYSGPGTSGSSDNTIRYNISQNDGRRPESSSAGGIFVSEKVKSINIYGNTVYLSGLWGSPRLSAINIVSYGNMPKDVLVANNIFITTVGAAVVSVGEDVVASARFLNNSYWASGHLITINFGKTTYSSIADWRDATGQEQFNNKSLGTESDPLVTDPGSGRTLNNPDLLPSLSAYILKSNSPLIDRGIDLQGLFGLDIGDRDFFQNPLLPSNELDIGAHEFF